MRSRLHIVAAFRQQSRVATKSSPQLPRFQAKCKRRDALEKVDVLVEKS
jgi:hypothetical protein